jgi:hypothetical protein
MGSIRSALLPVATLSGVHKDSTVAGGQVVWGQ